MEAGREWSPNKVKTQTEKLQLRAHMETQQRCVRAVTLEINKLTLLFLD